MKPALSNRVAERLRRLREKFGEGIYDRHVDHDHEHLTSTRRDLVPVRTFFLGEVWWAERSALGECRLYREGSSHLPGLVTRRQENARVAVECAPPGRGGGPAPQSPCSFGPQETAPGLNVSTIFHLVYRRPVARPAFGAPIGKLSGTDVQRLASALQSPAQPSNPACMP